MTHPARLMPFDTLCASLQSAISAGDVHEQADGDLRLYCYTKQCGYERHWTPITEMARGLILDIAAKKVVATPFGKFFNIGERAANDNFPALPFETFEKADGSLIIIFWHGGKWRCATKGSFNSEQARKAAVILDGTLGRNWLVRGDTYLAEYVGPDNRIVVPYAKNELVMLGAYDSEGEERPSWYSSSLAICLGWRAVKTFQFDSIAALVATTPTLPSDQEGFVIRFEDGYRLKVKGDEYKRIHALISRCTPLAMWEAMRDGIDVSALRKDLPEEFWADFDAILAALNRQIDGIRNATESVAGSMSHLSDKELGLNLHRIPQIIRPYLFPYRNGTMDTPRTRDKLFRQIRPTGNLLPGYIPSYAINHAISEAA